MYVGVETPHNAWGKHSRFSQRCPIVIIHGTSVLAKTLRVSSQRSFRGSLSRGINLLQKLTNEIAQCFRRNILSLWMRGLTISGNAPKSGALLIERRFGGSNQDSLYLVQSA